MPAPISVIIPTLNAAARLGPCLGALGEAIGEGLIAEVILVDGGSEDAIEDVAEAVGAVLIRTDPGRGVQLREAARVAKGSWFLFLHADSVLAEGWTRAARDHLDRARDRAGWFRLAFNAPGRMARLFAGWANVRSLVFGLPYGDQGLFVRRDVYEAAGGYPATPLMEDVALVRALGRRRLRRIDHVITTSAERYLREGWLRRGTRNLTVLAGYFLGQDVDTLARRYRR